MLATSEYSIAFTVDNKVDLQALKHQLEQFGSVGVEQGKASLCLVGKGLRGRAGIADRIFKPLKDVRVYMVSYGASDLNLTLLIDEVNVNKALTCLHQEFFDTGILSETFESIVR
jgi:aspartate kinase